MGLSRGERVGRYVVERKLAEGGMAELFLASVRGPAGFDKEVVLKRVHPFLVSDPEFVRMFEQEARLASRLNHANVVQVFDFDRHADSYFLAMEYVSGRSLHELHRRARERRRHLAPVWVAHVGAEVARGLGYAHRLEERGRPLGIVHRDVTPQNVLLSFEGAVKLTDFGVAKAGESRTAAGVLKGKFAYMAPEQARGEPVDARTDVFALGIVLWELVTGTRLFEADGDAGVLRAVQDRLITPPARLNPDIPEALDAAIMRALERDPGRRFSSAEGLERALRDFILSTATAADETDVGTVLRELFPEEARRSDDGDRLGDDAPAAAADARAVRDGVAEGVDDDGRDASASALKAGSRAGPDDGGLRSPGEAAGRRRTAVMGPGGIEDNSALPRAPVLQPLPDDDWRESTEALRPSPMEAPTPVEAGGEASTVVKPRRHEGDGGSAAWGRLEGRAPSALQRSAEDGANGRRAPSVSPREAARQASRKLLRSSVAIAVGLMAIVGVIAVVGRVAEEPAARPSAGPASAATRSEQPAASPSETPAFATLPTEPDDLERSAEVESRPSSQRTVSADAPGDVGEAGGTPATSRAVAELDAGEPGADDDGAPAELATAPSGAGGGSSRASVPALTRSSASEPAPGSPRRSTRTSPGGRTPPRRSARTSEPPARPRAPTSGVVTLLLRPYAIVYVDGERVGEFAGRKRLELPAGKRSVRLEHHNGSRTFELNVRSGREESLEFDALTL